MKTPESGVMSGVFPGSSVLPGLPRESSGGRTRTCDPTVNSRLLYQLSYAGKLLKREEKKATQGRLECQRDGVDPRSCDSSMGWSSPSTAGRRVRCRGLRPRAPGTEPGSPGFFVPEPAAQAGPR